MSKIAALLARKAPTSPSTVPSIKAGQQDNSVDLDEELFSAIGADYYDRFRPAYRYGFESATRLGERSWEEVEAELRAGWDRYEYRKDHTSTWDDIKAAVRDAWDRARGRA